MTTKNDGFDAAEGNTPLDEDEIVGLIPAHVQTRAELNAWEATNIGHAIEWAYGRAHVDVLSVETLQELHRRMFGATWTWAGTFRRADKNISPHHWPQVPMLVGDLVMDTRHSTRRTKSHRRSSTISPCASIIAWCRSTRGRMGTAVTPGSRQICCCASGIVRGSRGVTRRVTDPAKMFAAATSALLGGQKWVLWRPGDFS